MYAFRLRFQMKFVPEVRISKIPALVQIMAWRRPRDKPLSEPMMVNLLTHICVTRPQWVNISSQCLQLAPQQWSYCFHRSSAHLHSEVQVCSNINHFTVALRETTMNIAMMQRCNYWNSRWGGDLGPLTHLGRDKKAVIFQTTFSNAFSWMKIHKLR